MKFYLYVRIRRLQVITTEILTLNKASRPYSTFFQVPKINSCTLVVESFAALFQLNCLTALTGRN